MSSSFDLHAPILSPQRDLVKALHSLNRDFATPRNRHNAGMATATDDLARLVAGLKAFFKANKAALKNSNVWSKAAGVSYNAVNEPLSGAKKPNISIMTIEKMADGASKLLKRPVTIDELIGRDTPVPELDDQAEALFSRMSAEQKANAIKRLADSLGQNSREP